MFITLEKEDYQVIATEIAKSEAVNETVKEEVEINGINFDVKFCKDIFVEHEDGYENGTGATNVESCNVFVFSVKLSDDESVAISYNSREIESIAERMIIEG